MSHLKSFFLVFLFIATACNTEDEKNPEQSSTVNSPNVILLIGDGMGHSQLSALYYFKDTDPNVSRFSTVGLSKTSSSSHKITDSGASGTAMACGEKTYNGAIGVSADTLELQNITEYLSKIGYNTGLIATSSLTHATPASFFAHSKSRGLEEAIAAQLPSSSIDFFAAGGLKYFNKRADEVNYLDSLKSKGFSLDTTALYSNFANKEKLGFLLNDGAMPKMIEGRGDFLPKASRLAIDFLKAKEASFFVMVEGSQIDWGGHANNHDYIVGEMNDFDDAIGEALDFAEKDGNTLVIVTADHETGGYTLRSGTDEDGNTDYDNIEPSFSTGGHSAALVPVLAYGPGAEKFTGIYENTELFQKIKTLTSSKN